MKIFVYLWFILGCIYGCTPNPPYYGHNNQNQDKEQPTVNNFNFSDPNNQTNQDNHAANAAPLSQDVGMYQHDATAADAANTDEEIAVAQTMDASTRAATAKPDSSITRDASAADAAPLPEDATISPMDAAKQTDAIADSTVHTAEDAGREIPDASSQEDVHIYRWLHPHRDASIEDARIADATPPPRDAEINVNMNEMDANNIQVIQAVQNRDASPAEAGLLPKDVGIPQIEPNNPPVDAGIAVHADARIVYVYATPRVERDAAVVYAVPRMEDASQPNEPVDASVSIDVPPVQALVQLPSLVTVPDTVQMRSINPPAWSSQSIASLAFVDEGGYEYTVLVYPKRPEENLLQWANRSEDGDSFASPNTVSTRSGHTAYLYITNDEAALPDLHVSIATTNFVYIFRFDIGLPDNSEEAMQIMSEIGETFDQVPVPMVDFIRTIQVQ